MGRRPLAFSLAEARNRSRRNVAGGTFVGWNSLVDWPPGLGPSGGCTHAEQLASPFIVLADCSGPGGDRGECSCEFRLVSNDAAACDPHQGRLSEDGWPNAAQIDGSQWAKGDSHGQSRGKAQSRPCGRSRSSPRRDSSCRPQGKPTRATQLVSRPRPEMAYTPPLPDCASNHEEVACPDE